MNYDLVIVGGGPAGMAAAIYAGRAELKTLVLEKMMMGGQMALTMDIANYPGFPENIDGPTLASRMRSQAEKFGVEFRNAESGKITRADDGSFLVPCKDDMIQAGTVIIATGSDPRKLNAPGENEYRGKGGSYCGTCDAPFFRGKKVVVIGGGDSALKESLHIVKFASEVTLVHRRDKFRGEKIYQKQVLGSDRIQVKWNTVLKEIKGETSVTSVLLDDVNSGDVDELKTDGVFIFVGTVPNTTIICDLIPANCNGHIETDLDMMSSVPGLFAVGDVREHSYRQVATAVGEGATAAIAAEHYLENRKEA